MASTLTRAPAVPVRESSRPLWRRAHYIALAVVASVQALVRVGDPVDSDMLWSARFGWDFLRSGRLPAVDSWSWTASGHQFIANSWAWNIVLGISYHAAGVYGFWLIMAGMSIAVALTVGRVAAHYGVAPLPLIAVWAAVGALGVETLPRAQTLSNVAVLFVPLLALRLMRAADKRAFMLRLGQIGVFELVWMNLHAGALIGPVLFGGATLAIGLAERRTRSQPQVLGRAVAAAVVSSAACLITPYGLAGVTHSVEVRESSVGLISEWQPAGFSTLPAMLGLAGAAVGALLAMSAWRRGRPAVAACLVLLAIASLTAIRFLPELTVLAAPELAAFLAPMRVREVMWTRIALVTLTITAGQAVMYWHSPSSLAPVSSPGLVNSLPSGCRLLNDDLVGDAVILLRPDIRVALDGRNDVYGRKLLLQLSAIFDGGAHARRWINEKHVTCVLAPSGVPLVQQLTHDPAWRTTGTDELRTLLIRRHA